LESLNNGYIHYAEHRKQGGRSVSVADRKLLNTVV